MEINKKRLKFSIERLKEEALKYKTRYEFKKGNPFLYRKASRLKMLNEVCSHMGERINEKWSLEELIEKSKECNTIKEFEEKYVNEYASIKRRNLLYLFSHMKRLWEEKWNEETVKIEASKYKTRSEFTKNNGSAYNAAKRLNILDEVCKHMKLGNNTSYSEQNLFDIIKQKYPKTQKLRDRKVKIEGKPHIQGFDIDIYIPELRKGIEFDGSYWRSVEGLKRSRIDWPEEDLINYHQIKDKYFLSKKIKILHIKEQDWLKDRESCIKNCLEFLTQ